SIFLIHRASSSSLFPYTTLFRSGEWWVYCPSTLHDNPHLDQEKYRRTLESALRDDPEALKALLEGSFTSQTGAYFGACLDERRKDRKSTRLNSSHVKISYAVFCL